MINLCSYTQMAIAELTGYLVGFLAEIEKQSIKNNVGRVEDRKSSGSIQTGVATKCLESPDLSCVTNLKKIRPL